MAKMSRQRSREIIEDIMSSYRGITAADRAPPSFGAEIAAECSRNSCEGHHHVSRSKSFCKTSNPYARLSNQLYSKDTKFVYELIQNAEDNSYSSAQAKGLSPSLVFAVASNKIVIDSNEDGFTEENVRAICKLGCSTKSASRGFIGEKGIGFKSVFKVASRVRVQSGPFCFAFEHGEDDHGLGMVTPINDDHENLPENVHTRFTLTLNENSSLEHRVAEFKSLPDTLLLFLAKINKFTIRTEINLIRSKTVYDYTYDESRRLGSLTRTAISGFFCSSMTSKQY